ncbi:MAG: epoxyqueuosine reductase QueH [Dehalococcoidia bacterium]|jgi:predicted adenine nucleotide alpha hydrolase (AANH) superfamily ATPase
MKIVLHVCCGICAAGAASVLIAEGHTVTGYFYNPNIFPESEYCRRLAAARTTANRLGFSLVEGPYDPSAWDSATEAFKHEPEGGLRCSVCYRLRLERSYKFMVETANDVFTSTLTISPHKSAKIINAIGEEMGGVSFLARDFKKKDGFKKATHLAKSWELYRQNYCGCLYSKREGDS